MYRVVIFPDWPNLRHIKMAFFPYEYFAYKYLMKNAYYGFQDFITPGQVYNESDVPPELR